MGTGRRLVPTAIWLYVGGLLGAVSGVVVYVGGQRYLAEHSATVFQFDRDWATAKPLLGLAVVGGLTLGVLLDGMAFARRGSRVGGLPVLLWACLVGGFAFIGFPMYTHFRAKAVLALRADAEVGRVAGRRAWFPAAAGVLGLCAVVVLFGVMCTLALEFVAPSTFVVTEDDDHDAAKWLEASGYDAQVGCDRSRFLRVGDTFRCYGFDEKQQLAIVIEGSVPTSGTTASWRIVSVEAAQ